MGMAFLIDRKQLALVSERKVLKQSEYLTALDAQGLLAEAERKAQAILAAAREVFHQEQQRGYREGVAEGKQQMAAELASLSANAARTLQSLEEKIVATVMKALASILRGVDDKVFFAEALRQVSVSLRGEKFLALRVCPAQEQAALEALSAIGRELGTPNFINVIAEPSMALGACVIATEAGTVDASLDTQLAAIRKSITHAFAGSDD
jgi:type III secretion protein L